MAEITISTASLRMKWTPTHPLGDFGTLEVTPKDEARGRKWVERGVLRRRGHGAWVRRAQWLIGYANATYHSPCECPACSDITLRVVGTDFDEAGRLFQMSECENCGHEES